MADTIRSKVELLNLFLVGIAGGVSAQDSRDLIVSFFGGYGSIILEEGVTAQTLAAATPELLAEWTADGVSNGATPSYASGQITIDNAGDYQITFSVTFSGIATAIQHFRLYKNGSPAGVAAARYTSNNDIGSAGFVCQVALIATDVLSVWVESDKAGDITSRHVQLTISRIG